MRNKRVEILKSWIWFYQINKNIDMEYRTKNQLKKLENALY